MVAIIGYPGESKHTWARFAAKGEALAWLESKLAEMCGRHTAAAASLTMSARVVSEKTAAAARYRDGRRCYPRDAEVEHYAGM